MSTTPSGHMELPVELREALVRFQRRWRWISLCRLIGFLALIPLSSFALLSVSDRLWDTPEWIRWILAVPVPICMTAALVPFVKQWILDVPGPRRLARFMGRLDARVGDRLLGAVELSEGTDEQEGAGSPALRRAAIQQVGRELSGVRTEDRLDVSRVKKILLGAAVVFVVVSSFTFLSPQAAFNSLQRWLRPYGDLERFTFVRFSGFPDHRVVPHGESFLLTGEVRHVNDRAVESVSVTLDGPESVSLVRKENALQVEGEGVTRERNLRLAAGDGLHRIRVIPMLRPELVGLNADITWPAYLEREPTAVRLRRHRLEVPAGSRVNLRAEISREVREVLGPTMARVRERVVTLPDIPVEEDRRMEFSWVDAEGLRPLEPAIVQLIAGADAPPSVSLSGLNRAVAVLGDEVLELDLRARDDFGLQRVWSRLMERNPEKEPTVREIDTGLTGPEGDARVVFSPELFGFEPGSRIELSALAVDAFPGREPSESARFHILVLSKAEHAKLLLQQMERVLADLDESIRQESLAMEENEMTLARSEEDLLRESTTEALEDRALEERTRNERLAGTREQLEDLLVEAAKNDQIADQRIAEWATISESLKAGAEPAMQAAAEAMARAAEAQSPPAPGESSERADELEEAVARQREAIEAMRREDRNLDESIRNSLAESFVNRFRDLARREAEIQAALAELLPVTIGLRPEDLPEEARETLIRRAEEQEEVHRLTRYLHDDLEGFFQRTQQPVLDEITGEMDQENFNERLPALETLIRRNTIGLSTGEAQAWTDLFLAWAERLQGEPPPSGAGEGGGGQDEEGEELETMIALIRARERQENLRRQVRSLDESYETNADFHRDAVLLADRQNEIAHDLQPLENRVKKEETKQLVSLAAGESMNAGVRLRRPDTGAGTIAVQTEVIERIAAALEQSMSGASGSDQEGNQQAQQNSARITRAVLQMMQSRSPSGSMAGSQGGEGQTGGGDPGRGRPGGEGSALSGDSGRGSSGTSGGTDPSVWPGRYRGMMDAYYDAVENSP